MYTLHEKVANSQDRNYRIINVNKKNIVVQLFRFVITEQGELRCGSNDEREHYSHGQLAGNNQNVAAAGEFGFDCSKKLVYISNKTGHYRVPSSFLPFVYSYLMDHEGFKKSAIKKLQVRGYDIHQEKSAIAEVGEFEYQENLLTGRKIAKCEHYPCSSGSSISKHSRFANSGNGTNLFAEAVHSTSPVLEKVSSEYILDRFHFAARHFRG